MVERAVPPPKLRWRLGTLSSSNLKFVTQCEGEGEFRKDGLEVCLNDVATGLLVQMFSYDGGESWERALDWYWNGSALQPLPCRKSRTCTSLSGHKGTCR